MQLSELKTLPLDELISLGEACGIENAARVKRQDVVFAILKNKSKQGEDIDGGGVLEILQDGFGFLRSPDSSYLAGPDDIYVSPSQIRRFRLRTGDTIQGKIRPPKDGERYFAILKIDEINFEADIPGYIDNSMLVEAIVAQQILPKGALLNGRITMDAENYYILSYDFLELENIVQALTNLQ